MDRRRVILTPRARRELFGLEDRLARQVADDLGLLETPPWRPGKVKKLHGHRFWEMKSGDFRAIFVSRGEDVIVARIVNRRDLRKTIGAIDLGALMRWARRREEE